MKSKYTILLLLTLLPVFASALITPGYFAPLRVPAYLVSVVIALVMMAKHTYKFILLYGVYCVIFLILILNTAAFNTLIDLPVLFRQLLYHFSLFFCAYIGYIAFRNAGIWAINYTSLLSIMFIIIFSYGIYTYIAQLYDYYEVLWFLRPSPSVKVIAAENIYSQDYHGALNRYRAYSVWYEPSYSSLALACGLPLIFLCKKRHRTMLLVLSIIYGYLTYSRSSWCVILGFILIYVCSLSNFRLSVWGLSILLISMVPITLYGGFLFTLGDSDQSAMIRYYNSIQALEELSLNSISILTGLGTPDLFYRYMVGNVGSAHVTNAFIAMLHWLGIIGLVFLLIPLIIIFNKARFSDHKNYWAVSCYVILASVALNVGGNFFGISLFWFFIGVYYAIAEHAVKEKNRV